MLNPHDFYFGHSWTLGHGDFASIDEVRVAMEDSRRELVADGIDPSDEPPLGVVFLPYPEIILVYWGLSGGAGDYSACQVKLKAETPAGFTPEDLIFKAHRATLETLAAADHIYPEGFSLDGSESAEGLPIVRMECGN